jgi:hypothetical protein
MNPGTPKTEPPPSTQLRKVVFGGAHYLIVAALNRAASKSNRQNQTPSNEANKILNPL